MRCVAQLGLAALFTLSTIAYSQTPSQTQPQTPAQTPAQIPPATTPDDDNKPPLPKSRQNQTSTDKTSPSAASKDSTTPVPANPSAATPAPTVKASDPNDKTLAPDSVPANAKDAAKNDKSTPSDSKKDAPVAAAKSDTLPSPGESLDPHIKPGSEDDVNAVGTRNIGGRGMGNWYSIDSEVRMGKQYSMEIEKSAHMVTDPVVVEYVNRVGQNIVKNSDCKVPFTIKVIDSDEINAMALPGGFFYVNSGLILAADEEAELAGVMAHETAHVCAHHAAREMTRLNYMQIGSIPLIIFTQGSWTGYGIYEAAQLAVPITFLQFSRSFEAEADWLGLQYMYKSGYDPQAFIQFFEKIDALEKHKPGTLAKVFADHPQTPDRIAHSEDEIATIMPARADYVVTTSEFDDVKSRLARIENKRKVNDGKGGSKPTLRRAGGTNNDPNSPNTPGNSTDDRPTLGRRN
jgi:beta-barrel assembly-enhancing protease